MTGTESLGLNSRIMWQADLSAVEALRDHQGFQVVPDDPATPFSLIMSAGENADRCLRAQDRSSGRANLAWKLAYVLARRAGADLLDSYEAERRSIAASNVEWSIGNAPRFGDLVTAVREGNQARIDFWLRDMRNHLYSLARALGYAYDSPAIVSDGTVAPTFQSRYYVPTDRPGHRFPHVWLDAECEQSTIDWFEKEFVVVAGSDRADVWHEAAWKVAALADVVLRCEVPTNPRFEDGSEIGTEGCVIVRPDGHVGFRLPWLSEKPNEALTTALDQLLARSAQ